MVLILLKQVPVLSLFLHVKDPLQSRAFPLSATVYSLHVLLFGELLRCMWCTLQPTLKSLSHLHTDCLLMLAEGPAGTLICHNGFERGAYRPRFTCPSPLGYFPALWTRVQSWSLNHVQGSTAPTLQGTEK